MRRPLSLSHSTALKWCQKCVIKFVIPWKFKLLFRFSQLFVDIISLIGSEINKFSNCCIMLVFRTRTSKYFANENFLSIYYVTLWKLYMFFFFSFFFICNDYSSKILTFLYSDKYFRNLSWIGLSIIWKNNRKESRTRLPSRKRLRWLPWMRKILRNTRMSLIRMPGKYDIYSSIKQSVLS